MTISVSEMQNAMQDAFITMTTAVTEALTNAAQFTEKVARAHYNVVGQYTFPIEGELTTTVPPNVADLNVIGQIVLGVVPVIEISWIFSLLIIPLLGNSVHTFATTVTHISSLALSAEDRDNIPTVAPPPGVVRNSYGVPGYLVGGVFGAAGAAVILLGRLVTNIFKTGAEVFVFMSNTVLPEGYTLADEKPERHWFLRYVVGSPGFIIGGVIGFVSMCIISVIRLMSNSAKTGSQLFVTMSNWFLHSDEQIRFGGIGEDDNRHWFFKYFLGSPGLLIGGVIGFASMVLIAIGRVITNSYKIGYLILFNMTQASLDKSDRKGFISLDRDRPFFLKYVLGFPGMLVGGALGLVSMFLVGLGRFVTNSVKSAYELFMAMTNFVLDKEDKLSVEKFGEDGHRKWYYRYLLGGLGGLVGGIVGIIPMVVILAGRIITNSFKSGWDIFVSVFEVAFDENDREGIKALKNKNERPFVLKFIAGFPGLLIGGLVGLVAMGLIALLRIVSNSYKTARELIVPMANLFLHKDDQLNDPKFGPNNDGERKWYYRYLLGFPGGIIGFALGVVSMIAIAIGRFFTNSTKTGWRTFVTMSNLFLPSDLQIGSDGLWKEDHRHWFRKYIIGSPGLIIGGVAGIFSMLSIGLGRIVTNSFKSFHEIFVVMSNVALPVGLPLETPHYGVDVDNRKWYYRYLLGGLGGFLGFFAGVASMILIGLARVAYQSSESFAALTGSLLNGAFEKPIFPGLRNDKRSGPEKGIGVLGYIISAVVCVPLSIVIYVVRQLPLIVVALIGLILSPFLAVGKSISKCVKPPRFAEDNVSLSLIMGQDDVSLTMGRFKNLYSALNWGGDFNVGTTIVPGRDGRKEPMSFVRKCVTLNAKSLTERILDEVLKDFKAKGGEITNDLIDTAAEKVRIYYSNDCFISDEKQQANINQLNDVVGFLKRYLVQGDQHVQNIQDVQQDVQNDINSIVPVNLYHRRFSWTAAFFGRGETPSEDADVPRATI